MLSLLFKKLKVHVQDVIDWELTSSCFIKIAYIKIFMLQDDFLQ